MVAKKLKYEEMILKSKEWIMKFNYWRHVKKQLFYYIMYVLHEKLNLCRVQFSNLAKSNNNSYEPAGEKNIKFLRNYAGIIIKKIDVYFSRKILWKIG